MVFTDAILNLVHYIPNLKYLITVKYLNINTIQSHFKTLQFKNSLGQNDLDLFLTLQIDNL